MSDPQIHTDLPRFEEGAQVSFSSLVTRSRRAEIIGRPQLRKFGEHLEAAREAMETLAQKLGPEELARSAFGLYEQFRPAIPAGVKGWGAAGKLDLRQIVALG